MRLFGIATHKQGEEIKKLIGKLMATTQEVVDRLKATEAKLVAIATSQAGQSALMTKIAGETDGLNLKIEELREALENAGGISPEVEAALVAVETAAANVDASTTALGLNIATVDAKVPDAPAPEPPPA